MGKELEASIEFEVEHMLCHVINLAAKAGLKAVKASVPNLDSRLYEDEDDSDLQPWVDTGKSNVALNISPIGSSDLFVNRRAYPQNCNQY